MEAIARAVIVTAVFLTCLHGKAVSLSVNANEPCADCAELDVLRRLEESLRRAIDPPIGPPPLTIGPFTHGVFIGHLAALDRIRRDKPPELAVRKSGVMTGEIRALAVAAPERLTRKGRADAVASECRCRVFVGPRQRVFTDVAKDCPVHATAEKPGQ